MEPMHKSARPYWISLTLLAAALLLSVAVGSVNIPPLVLLRTLFGAADGSNTTYHTILFSLRLPRTLLVALSGAALAGSGAAYQGLFRNPLADPYLIGVAAGAGLGAVIAMSIQFPYGLAGLLAVPLAAFLGALVSVLMVYRLARSGRDLPTANLILAGVAISSFATALTSFLMLRASGELRRALVWLLGGSTLSGWLPVLALLPYVALGLGTLLTMGHALERAAVWRGAGAAAGPAGGAHAALIIIAATLTTAAAVSFTGVIGFVGLIVPHLVRLLWGGDYRRLLPLAMLSGASLLLCADVLARVVIAPQEIPVGIITALMGTPFFCGC